MEDVNKEERENYLENPEEYFQQVSSELSELRAKIKKEIASDTIVVAKDSNNPEWVKMQECVDTMANNSGLFQTPPTLLIHTPDSKTYISDDDMFNAIALTPEYIAIKEYSRDYFLGHLNQFKAVMAHEMGHLANGDQDIKNQIERNINPSNQKWEILADRMGAIIHGNPRDYAKYISEFMFYVSGKNETKPNHYSRTHLSTNGDARMLHKWADILEREGAMDKETGEIIDRKKAMEIFNRSKDLTTSLANIDSFSRR